MNDNQKPKVVLVMRSFLDYRIPVFKQLSTLLEGNLWVICSAVHVPERVRNELTVILGERLVLLEGEKTLGYRGNITSETPNTKWRIPYQPGIGEALKNIDPEVVVGDGFFQWTWQALVYRTLNKKKLMLCYERTAHTEKNAQWYRRVFRKLELPFINAMAVNGSLTRSYVESLGVQSDRIVEGQMAADTDDLARITAEMPGTVTAEMRQQYSSGSDSKIFLSVSRLIPLKGVSHLLEAWKTYQEGIGSIDSLVIVGEGPERTKLEALVEEWQLQNVHFVGHVEYEKIHQFYAMADWFVIPTLVDNWSLVVPEAMASGLPVLCSKYNGCWPELVLDDVNGWVFDPLDKEDVYRVLSLASQSDEKRMGDRSEDIVSKHTPKHAAQAIFDACQIAACSEH